MRDIPLYSLLILAMVAADAAGAFPRC